MRENSFPRKERLKKSELIKAVLDKGVSYRAKSLVVYILKTQYSEGNRAAFICRKNLYQKKTVLRNRIRRVLREAYRKTKYILPPGHDIVLLGTNITQKTKSLILEQEIKSVFQKYIKK